MRPSKFKFWGLSFKTKKITMTEMFNEIISLQKTKNNKQNASNLNVFKYLNLNFLLIVN